MENKNQIEFKIKMFLNSAKVLSERKIRKIEEIKMLKEMKTNISVKYEERVQSTPIQNKIEYLTIEIENKQDELENLKKELEAAQFKISLKIIEIEKLFFKKLLEEKYVECKSNENIAKEMNYEQSYMNRLISNATKEFIKHYTKKLYN